MDIAKGEYVSIARMPAWLIAFSIAFSIAISPASAESMLDQKLIHGLYNDGDFDGVTQQIAAFRQQSPVCSREDSIFVAKHLAVVYAANPRSVGQGKYWMNELLKLMPAADLVGMYVSDEIDRIFESVRREFLARQRSFGIYPDQVALPDRPKAGSGDAGKGQDPGMPGSAAAIASPASGPADPSGAAGEPGKKSGSKRPYWIMGGSALAATAVGVATYLVLSTSHASAPEREITIARNPEVQ